MVSALALEAFPAFLFSFSRACWQLVHVGFGVVASFGCSMKDVRLHYSKNVSFEFSADAILVGFVDSDKNYYTEHWTVVAFAFAAER